MKRSACVLAIVFVACVAGSVPSNFADIENEELYENPAAEMEMHILPEKRGSRGLDPMAGVTFGTMRKRIDSLSGGSFGSQKRSEDSIRPHLFRKNILINSHETFDRHLDREQPSALLLPKKTSTASVSSAPAYPYPYYLSYAPVYYRLKDKGM